jgi:hypothetical protein
MRNTTKLKHVLLKYTAEFNMNDDGVFTLTLIDKFNPSTIYQFEGKSYAIVLSKSYSHLLKELKINDRNLMSE